MAPTGRVPFLQELPHCGGASAQGLFVLPTQFPANPGSTWGLSLCVGRAVKGPAFSRGQLMGEAPGLPTPMVFASVPPVLNLPPGDPDGSSASAAGEHRMGSAV